MDEANIIFYLLAILFIKCELSILFGLGYKPSEFSLRSKQGL
jgi:hypothetical protein